MPARRRFRERRGVVLPCAAMSRRSAFALVALCSLAMVPACGGGGDDHGGGGPDAVSASCMEATTYQDLPTIEDKIFRVGCSSFNSCHMGAANMAEGLNLEAGMAHGNLVNVDAAGFPQYKRVVPGDPQNSYLLIALGRYPGPLGESGRMPVNNPPLCNEKLDAIERWITAGAPAN